jgi:hypothetical protein
MYVSAAVLGLAGAAAAAAAAAAAVAPVGPTYPVTNMSKGFRLVVKVTDPSGDWNSIHNTYISSIHDGHPGSNVLAQVEDAQKGHTFYLNGTGTDHNDNKVLTESFSDISAGLELVNEDSSSIRTARLVQGHGDGYFSLLHYGEHAPFLRPETWVACKEKLALYTKDKKEYIIFKQAAATRDPTSGRYELHVPRNCARVTLLPECTKLNDLPKASAYMPKNIAPTHEHAIDAHCYPDVKAIDWRKYASD